MVEMRPVMVDRSTVKNPNAWNGPSASAWLARMVASESFVLTA